MNRTIASLALLSTALLSGCVERRFVVETVIPGVPQDGQAQVLHNGHPIGISPADDSFVYYGKHQLTLVKDGYQTLHVEERLRAPWYEFPPLDFIAENIVPWKIRDVRRLRYTMQPLQATPPESVRDHATPMRERARLLGDPAPPRPVPKLAPPEATAPTQPPPQ